MSRAHSNVGRAKLWTDGVYLEDLCFDAQQAAEKAVKALLLARGVPHPIVHDLAALLSLPEESGVDIPVEVFDAALLTRYTAPTRYLGHMRPVTATDHREAVILANRAVWWVERIL